MRGELEEGARRVEALNEEIVAHFMSDVEKGYEKLMKKQKI